MDRQRQKTTGNGDILERVDLLHMRLGALESERIVEKHRGRHEEKRKPDFRSKQV